MRRIELGVAICVIALASGGTLLSQEGREPQDAPLVAAERLRQVQAEISNMEADLQRLSGEKRSLLGEWNRLDATLSLRRNELEAASLSLSTASERLEQHDSSLAQIDQAQRERRRYLEFRLREIYKAGTETTVQRLFVADDQVQSYWEGLHYAEVLSERDGRILNDYRGDSVRAREVRAQLVEARDELLVAHDTLVTARDRAADARRQRQKMIDGLRRDEARQKAALIELREAATQLTEIARSAPQTEATAAGITASKGTLDWPSQGPLRNGFGQTVHPTFRTKVPHPGWDIGAEFGSDVRAIFEGEVVFADWMRGYGLTCIVNHGEGVMSVYAHASMLLAHEGELVKRGQLLAKVGDTGSLNGTHLYFELRVDGRPADPRKWLETN